MPAISPTDWKSSEQLTTRIDADGSVILSFAQAQAVARERFVEGKRVAAGQPAVIGPYTVNDAINEYIAC